VDEDRKEERGKGARGLRRRSRARPDWAAGTNAKRVGSQVANTSAPPHEALIRQGLCGRRAWPMGGRGGGGRERLGDARYEMSGLDVFCDFF
jgi:hypothetical protein